MSFRHEACRSALRRSGLAMLALTALAPAVAAEGVVLRLKGGNFQIEGELRSFDGAKYHITSSRIGDLTLDASRFDCIGAACRITTASPALSPAPAALGTSEQVMANVSPTPSNAVSLMVPASLGATLLPDLIKAWANSIGGSIVRELTAEPGGTRLRALDRTGAVIAVFDIHRRSADQAFQALEAGSASIVLSDRRIGNDEAAALAPLAGNMRSAARETVIGLDAFAVVVGPDSPVVSMSARNMAAIFSGAVTDWSQLGMPAGRIAIYGNATTTGSGSLFEQQILQPNGRSLVTSVTQLPSSAAVAEAVAGERGAIGVTAYADMNNAKPVNIEQSCGLITPATQFSVKTEEYPLSRRLYLYTAQAQAKDAAQKLLAFVSSPKAHAIVADNQFVSQSLDTLSFGEHGGRIAHAATRQMAGQDPVMRQLLAELGKAERLTTTIRFDSGTSVIDSKSQNDLVSLAGLMKRPDMQQKTIFLVGFSDVLGTAAKNTSLALKRAQQVRTSLLAVAGGQVAPTRIVARGYGSFAPIACDDTDRGRQLNRRVEVWIRDEPAPAAAAPSPTAKR